MALMTNEAVDVVQVGSGTSGITGALQVADMAYGFELPVSVMNSPGNHMAHLAAALPNHIMMEVIDAGFEAVLQRRQSHRGRLRRPRRRARTRLGVRPGEARADVGRPLRRQNQRRPHGPPPRRRPVPRTSRRATGARPGVVLNPPSSSVRWSTNRRAVLSRVVVEFQRPTRHSHHILCVIVLRPHTMV